MSLRNVEIEFTCKPSETEVLTQTDYEKAVAESLGYSHFNQLNTAEKELAHWAQQYFKDNVLTEVRVLAGTARTWAREGSTLRRLLNDIIKKTL